MFDLLTILPLAVAAFVFWKLRQVLGTRGGAEPPARPPHVDGSERSTKRPSNAERPANDGAVRPARRNGDDNVVAMPNASKSGSRPVRVSPPVEETVDPAIIARHAEGNENLRRGLEAIARRDPSFDPDSFLQGARMAYEMIVTAFADADRATLKNLLSAEVYESFNSVLDERDSRGERVEASFVGIETAKIADAALEEDEAQVTVSFVSQMVSATRDREGEIVDGDEHEVAEVTDVWTFARSVLSDDPNWKLVATDA